ncbi:MAG: ABC transporter ATP-binding protein [Lachnospiraceae bacterium]|jgi:branched-chain amino acid transport system ATP-binding protein|nr:ABC transporter ATP-binding protein [Lachnospiraceae bacterium]
MLVVKGLHSFYGNIEALHGVEIEVNDKEIVALIGSNGAGKTTLLNSVSGHVTKTGEIRFQDEDITKLPPHKIAKRNLLQVPEGRHVFPGLSVEQNLLVGTTAEKGLRLRAGNNGEFLEMVYGIFPRLLERRKQLAWSLSGGEQQMLAIGRALMGKPKLLMLDEPSMGLAPLIIEELFEKIVEINRAGTPVLLVEQNAHLALSVSERAYILERGKITLSGKSADLIHDSRVMEAYLGKRNKEQERET